MSQVDIESQLMHLVGRFYDAAADEALWAGIAVDISAAMKSTSAVLKLHGSGGAIRLLEHTNNLGISGDKEPWARHWHEKDLWVARSAAFGVSQVVTDQDLVTPEEQRKTGFYQEWLRALDIHHMVGAVFPSGDGVLAVLGVHRPERAGAYEEADRRKLRFLLPHLQRALRLGQQLSESAGHRAIADEALQRIDAALFAVDEHRHVVTMNGRAETLIRENPKYIECHHGNLILGDTLLNHRMAQQIRACVQTAKGSPAALGEGMVLPRSGRLPLTMLISPLPPADRASRGHAIQHLPLALVMVRDPEAQTLEFHCLRQLFGFTRTEAAVAADLASGQTLEAVAKRRHVGAATIRTHLKSILQKTGTHRQAEAVALIARSVVGLSAVGTNLP